MYMKKEVADLKKIKSKTRKKPGKSTNLVADKSVFDMLLKRAINPVKQ